MYVCMYLSLVGATFLGGNLYGWNFLGWNFLGEILLGGSFLGGNFRYTHHLHLIPPSPTSFETFTRNTQRRKRKENLTHSKGLAYTVLCSNLTIKHTKPNQT